MRQRLLLLFVTLLCGSASLLLGLEERGWAAISCYNTCTVTSSTNSVAASSITFGYTCNGTNPFTWVYSGVREDTTFSNTPITGVTYNGTALTKVKAQPNNPIAGEAWYFVGLCDGSAHNIVISYTGTVTQMSVGAFTLNGVDSGTPLDGVTPVGTNYFAQSVSDAITTNTANDWTLDMVVSSGAFTGNSATGTNQTAVQTGSPICGNGSDCNVSASYETTTAAGSYTMSWTLNAGGANRSISHIVAAVKASGSSPASSGFNKREKLCKLDEALC